MRHKDIADLARNMRRLGPPALVAACLAASPALAQTVTVTPDQPSTTVESSESRTKIKENSDGTVTKKTTTENTDGSVTKEKTRTTVDEPSTTTTTTVR